MIKKTITYEDYDGITCKEDFHFGLNKSEMTMLNMSEQGGLTAFIRRIVKERDNKRLAKLWEDLILISYGEKSDDGKRFVKSPEISQAFKETPAYDVLFMELFGNTKNTITFMKGIIPADIAKQINEQEISKKLNDTKVLDLSSDDSM